MPNKQNNSTMELTGSIKLTDLKFVQVSGQPGNMWLQIPIDANPALFMTQDKQTGKPSVSLDISIWRNENPKFGNTHYIRASVGKKNGEHLTEEQRREATVILGNARVYTPKAGGQQGGYGQQGAYPQGPQAPGAPGVPGAPGMYPQQGGFPQGAPAGFQQAGYGQQGPYAPAGQAPGQYPAQQQGFVAPPQPGAGYDPNDLP